MNYNKKTVRDIDVAGKKVLLRCDFNVPMAKDGSGVITDDKRIRAALPTIQYLLEQNAAVVACSHMGKPKGEVKPELSLKPVAARLSELLGKPVIMAEDVVGPDARAKAAALKPGENQITICATDTLRTQEQPSGKQSPAFHSFGCFYTRTTGIWQTVWLENVPEAYIARLKYTPDIESGTLFIEAVCENAHGLALRAQARFQGEAMGEAQATVSGRTARMALKLQSTHLWSTETPALYDLTLTLGEDAVESYFGMRSIAFAGGKLLLNGKPVFQRLVLDQGFYPDGIYTAPSDAALEGDIRLSMDMGFNGARLHEKIFEERFLYHCDRLGYLVWGEQANWGLDIARPEAWRNFLPEWLEELERDCNHPALVGWCPLNETQKDQDSEFVRFLVNLTRAFDPTRPVLDSSGWTHVDGLCELTDCHNYEQDPEKFAAQLDANGYPMFVSEFGGIRWSDDASGWGYGQGPKSEAEFLARYEGLVKALLSRPGVYAFCYTQLTDVEQEQNGLYTYERKPKFDPAIIRKINTARAAIETE